MFPISRFICLTLLPTHASVYKTTVCLVSSGWFRTHLCTWHASHAAVPMWQYSCMNSFSSVPYILNAFRNSMDSEINIVLSIRNQCVAVWHDARTLCMVHCVAVCCSVLQCVAVCCSALQSSPHNLSCVSSTSSQYVAVCCSLLQCLEVCCSFTRSQCTHRMLKAININLSCHYRNRQRESDVFAILCLLSNLITNHWSYTHLYWVCIEFWPSHMIAHRCIIKTMVKDSKLIVEIKVCRR